MSQSSFSFTLPHPIRYGPRVGSISLRNINIATPGILASTSRGAVPHLSRDHVRLTEALRWVNVPFETFLEHNPPIPILYAKEPKNASNPHPLQEFLGFDQDKQIVSMSARDPNETREMPPNGNAMVSVYSLRGVRKLSPAEWTSHVRICQPDIVFALSDTPFTDPPYSQKRLTKSIERSAAWLSNLLRPGPIPLPPPTTKKAKPLPTSAPPKFSDEPIPPPCPPVFVQLAGLTSSGARKAFSASLLEPLYGPDIAALAPLTTLDEGVAGYTIDLAPLKVSLAAMEGKSVSKEDDIISSLLQDSLAALPPTKPRLVTGVTSPHQILHLINTVGIDMFDATWALKAADVGVALDFAFPVRGDRTPREIGHNLYDVRYRLDFGCMATWLPAVSNPASPRACRCAACAPRAPPSRIYHGYDTPEVSGEAERERPGGMAPYTRAYVHHLLHTHEMSAHALLAMHNLSVLDAFLAGVRDVLSTGGSEEYAAEVLVFGEVYDRRMGVLDEAWARWREVDLARGKGRLSREKGKEEGTPE